MRLPALRVISLAASLLAPVLMAGCYFPLGGLGSLDDDQFPFPTVLAEYATGSAQMVLTQNGVSQTLTLSRVGRGSALNNFAGAAVSWKTEDGWVLQVTAYEFGSFPELRPSPAATSSPSVDSGAYSGDITIQRIQGNEFWTASSYSDTGNRCIVDIEDADEAGIRGSATCRGLRWADGTAPNLVLSPAYIEDEEPFDAEITFEARP